MGSQCWFALKMCASSPREYRRSPARLLPFPLRAFFSLFSFRNLIVYSFVLLYIASHQLTVDSLVGSFPPKSWKWCRPSMHSTGFLRPQSWGRARSACRGQTYVRGYCRSLAFFPSPSPAQCCLSFVNPLFFLLLSFFPFPLKFLNTVYFIILGTTMYDVPYCR